MSRQLRDHYSYYGMIGNSKTLRRFYQWTIESAFKWLNCRGGKRFSFTWWPFNRALQLLNVARPESDHVGISMRYLA